MWCRSPAKAGPPRLQCPPQRALFAVGVVTHPLGKRCLPSYKTLNLRIFNRVDDRRCGGEIATIRFLIRLRRTKSIVCRDQFFYL